MCRLYGYLSQSPTRVECALVCAQNSLLAQSRRDHRGLPNADGWGMAWFDDEATHVRKHVLQAAADPVFEVAVDEIYARALVAHVRAATVGERIPANVHPFTAGRYAFAHNGTIPEFGVLGPRMASEIPDWLMRHRLGTTDSELCFLWLLGRLERRCSDAAKHGASLQVLIEVVRDGVRRLGEWCDELDAPPPTLNFVLSDGRVLVAARYGRTLFMLRRTTLQGCELCGTCHCPTCRARAKQKPPAHSHGEGVPCRAFVVASEPITDEGWVEVGDRTLVCVDEALAVQHLAI